MIIRLLPGLVITFFLLSCADRKEQKAILKETDTLRVTKVNEVVGVASIEPRDRIISLYAETGGIVKKIYHDIDETVKAGDVIVELSSDVEKAQLMQSRSKLATQQSAINSSKAQLASTGVKLENAKVDYERNQRLLESGAVTKQTVQNSKFNFESLTKDSESSEANVKQQRNKLGELQADIKYYEEIVKRKEIKAPVNGRVLSIDIKIGNNLSPSQAIGDFAPEGPLMAITEVDELFADQVKEGMKAYIRPQGKTDTLATGSIFLTSPYLRKKSLFSDAATNLEDRRVREVRVLLDKGSKVLIGSRVECVILIK